MRSVFVLALLVSGCCLGVDVRTVDTAEVVQWRQDITARVNDHEHRLSALEDQRKSDETAAIRGVTQYGQP